MVTQFLQVSSEVEAGDTGANFTRNRLFSSCVDNLVRECYNRWGGGGSLAANFELTVVNDFTKWILAHRIKESPFLQDI